MKICSNCRVEKPFSEFYSNGFQPSGNKKYKSRCRDCEVDSRRKDKEGKFEEIFIELKLKWECELCGYKKNKAALCFHHLEEDDKDFQISNFQTRSKESWKREIEKCVILCHNCHMELHHPHREIIAEETQ